MPNHVSMAPSDLVTQLEFLGLTLADLAFLTGTDEDWCVRIYTGKEPIPHWLNLLTVLWCNDVEALIITRECAIAMQEGRPTTEQAVGDAAGIAVVGVKPKLH